jgi:hypothetical protein
MKGFTRSSLLFPNISHEPDFSSDAKIETKASNLMAINLSYATLSS